MTFKLNNLPKIKRQSKIRVGRGIGSSKGKTCGRGVKGQKARTGHHSVKGFEGGQTPVHMRLPKKGFKNINKKIIEKVSINQIIQLIENNKISKDILIDKIVLENNKIIKSSKSVVKLIMHKKNIDHKIKILVDKYSKNAHKFA
jgi:large subunit ribosomal protein L15